MIWATIKKHGLLFWRNPSHMQLLIGLPMLLIAILGFSLQGFISNDTISSFNVNIAIMEHEDENEQVDRFIDSLDKQDLSAEKQQAIQQKAAETAPVDRFKQTVSDEFADSVTLTELSSTDDIEQTMEDANYDAIIEVPTNFTYNALESMFLNTSGSQNNQSAELQLYQSNDHSIASEAAADIINSYKQQLAFSQYASEMGMDQEALNEAFSASFGTSEHVGTSEPVSAKTYYAIGMITMNILFVATSIAMWAYYEREEHIFNRIVISRTPRSRYILGIFVAGSLYAFIQAVSIYCLSVLLFDVRWTDPGLFVLVTLALALTVGGLAAFLSSVSYRLESLAITSLFASFIIYMFAFLGGSFFPVSQYSEMIRTLGNFTPNGAGMTAYLLVMRGSDMSDIWPYTGSLVITGIVLLILALAIFPKRGGQV